MSKFLLIVVFVGVFFSNSLARVIIDHDDLTMSSSIQDNTTTSWWRRTFPITEIPTARPRSRPSMKSTTAPLRVSKVISISIPVALFSLTIFFGFGLILFAYITHGNGIFFLTRTDEYRLR